MSPWDNYYSFWSAKATQLNLPSGDAAWPLGLAEEAKAEWYHKGEALISLPSSIYHKLLFTCCCGYI